MSHLRRIHRVRLPLLGQIAVVPGRLIAYTHLQAVCSGRPDEVVDLGSGAITIGFVNDVVSDAVDGSAVVPTLARYRYHDSGTGTTPATDGQTALVSPAGPTTRASATLSNAQTATTANHSAQLLSTATITYSAPLSICEWGAFDAAPQGSGSMMDRRVFAPLTVNVGNTITFAFTVSIPSGG